MRMHIVRHVPFEGPGLIAEWASERGYDVVDVFGPAEEYPAMSDFDFLVVLGGPMAGDDEAGHPWLAAEKRFITEAISGESPVLGICLGSQLIAEAAGGSIKRCDYREIGWYPIRRTKVAATDAVFASFPDVLLAGQWHGDSFELPPGVSSSISTDACANQGFSLNGGRVVGVQFHLEWTYDDVERLIDECMSDLDERGPYVANAPDILAGAKRHIPACRNTLWMLLDLMVHMSERPLPAARTAP